MLILHFFSIPTHAFLGYILRGFKHCTGVCDKAENICAIEKDADFRWCVQNCSHKIDVKGICEGIFPAKLRPILPFENFSGAMNTNQVTPFALDALDKQFIMQTTDRRRLVGTVFRLFLVKAQYVDNTNVSKLTQSERESLAKKLFMEALKGDTAALASYTSNDMIPDASMERLFSFLKNAILAKWNNSGMRK